jgi:hypothetical protein
MQLVPAAFKPDELCAGDRCGQRFAMLDRIDRIGGAMDDHKRRLHLGKAAGPSSPIVNVPWFVALR